ncbi:hypothetical protein PUN4_550179 [Paraburkholderia unamae]|nr:hypothetical protein PUN4_550179 [Paraburkholderia unamae]
MTAFATIDVTSEHAVPAAHLIGLVSAHRVSTGADLEYGSHVDRLADMAAPIGPAVACLRHRASPPDQAAMRWLPSLP